MRGVVCTVLAMVWAAGADAVQPVSVTIRQSAERLATASSEQTDSGKPPGFTEWSAKLDSAKARRNSGKKVFWIGLGIATVVPVVAAVAITTDPLDPDTGNAANALTLVGLLGGTAMGVIGGIKWHNASEEIDDLDREGRIKGYLTLAPAPRGNGAQLALTLRF